MKTPREWKYLLAAGICLLQIILASPALSQEGRSGAIDSRIEGMRSQDGFVPVHYEEETGRIFLEVERLGEDFIYVNTLATGLGARSAGLDRGTLEYSGREALVRFERRGPQVLLVARNTRFRADSGDAAQQRAVEESFAPAIYAAFPVEAADGGRFLVDATDFFLSDVFDVAGRLRDSGEGSVRVDRLRSHIEADHTKAFPKNTEIRAVLTYETDEPGQVLRDHAPDAPLHGRAITLQQQHSLVALPEPGFRPRAFDPRVGSRVRDAFWDFSKGFDEGYQDHHIWRWRLEKKDPEASVSEPVKPIVFYLDPGIPEPYRTAFREGSLWWNEMFEAAGFRNALEIRDLPEGADPMDVRYSMIQWTHRTAPGSSTGPQVRDPRTGEILKAIVRMDSFRSLTSYNYYMGLVPALKATGARDPLSAEEFAMARRRQLMAHELGHALGFEHNFMASALGRASVMDYPAPLIRLDEQGRLDINDAYAEGGGEHDVLLARFGYTQFDSPEEEAAGLKALVDDYLARGYQMLAGRDGSLQAAHPDVLRWAEGDNMLDAMERSLAVREVLLEHFNQEAVRPGEPMANLADRLTHVYLHHRFSLEGAIKYMGGLEYSYALRGDGQVPTRIISGPDQQRALELVLSALRPEALAVPERITSLIPPTPYGYDHDQRWIHSPTGTVFDPLALAHVVANDIVGGLLHPQRASRLASFHARDPATLSLDSVISALIRETWGRQADAGMAAALLRVTQRTALEGLLELAASPEAPAEVRAVANGHLAMLKEQLEGTRGGTAEDQAHRLMAVQDIDRFQRDGQLPALRTGVDRRERIMELPWF